MDSFLGPESATTVISDKSKTQTAAPRNVYGRESALSTWTSNVGPVETAGGDKNPAFEKLISSDEAAALLGIHPKTLQRMSRRGEVPARKVGKLWRFRASDLDEWVRSGVISTSHPCRLNKGENNV